MKVLAAMMLAILVSACAAKPPAPVVDRSEDRSRERTEGRLSRTLSADGRYRVRRGDTLHAIAFSFGLDHRDVARWNAIRSPYTIYPDQLLRMTPPQAVAGSPKSKPSSATGTAATRKKPPGNAPAPLKQESPARAPDPVPEAPGADPQHWLWPVKGRLLRSYSASDPARNGLDIAGREGQPVIAAAAGTVVYSGNGLIGYGELIIIKHSERMLSAYAHNRVRLAGEGAVIAAGEKIAELGRNDRNEQVLHFEIRVNGRPVDPLRFLPKQ